MELKYGKFSFRCCCWSIKKYFNEQGWLLNRRRCNEMLRMLLLFHHHDNNISSTKRCSVIWKSTCRWLSRYVDLGIFSSRTNVHCERHNFCKNLMLQIFRHCVKTLNFSALQNNNYDYKMCRRQIPQQQVHWRPLKSNKKMPLDRVRQKMNVRGNWFGLIVRLSTVIIIILNESLAR